jgi:serine/threonine-protein kinase
MERLRGLDLQRMVDRHGPLPPERAVFLLKQVCRSLSEAHALGLVHRDIKPANLFVCRLGSEYDFLKVLDFGVVSAYARASMAPITQAGVILGTPAFMAPEFVSDESAFDGRADIYAIGCVGFWLLTGRTPFEGRDVVTLLMHHSRTVPSPPSMFSEAPISPDVDAAILACLSKDPAARPPTADHLWALLNATSVAAGWDQQRARAWWELHEPEIIAQP